MTDPHVRNLLGGYSLGILDADEQRAVDDHVAQCAECRLELGEVSEARDLLSVLPADQAQQLFVEEPPPVPLQDDLVLRRTLRAVRAERNGARNRRLASLAAGVAVLIAGAVGAGFVLGESQVEPRVALPTPSVTAPATTQPPGSRLLTATDPTSGVAATVNVVPAGNWVRLAVKVNGVKAGERCRLIAISRSGVEQVAGSWVIGARPPAPNAPGVPGSAAIAPADLGAIAVETEAGQRLVTVQA
jgi:anti-sigma factor RsiW